MKLEMKVIIGLCVLIIGQFFYSDYRMSQIEKEKLELRNRIVMMDSAVKEKDSSYTKLAYEYTSQKEIFNKLKQENEGMAKDVKKKNEIITLLLMARVKPDTVYVNTTTEVKDSVAYFKGYLRPYAVSGEFHYVDSTTRRLNVLMDEFKITAIGSKLENGFYSARLKFTDTLNQTLDMFKVYDFQAAVAPEKSKDIPFMNLGLGGELGANEFKVGVLLNFYDKNIFIVNYKLNAFKDIPNTWNNQVSIGYYRIVF